MPRPSLASPSNRRLGGVLWPGTHHGGAGRGAWGRVRWVPVGRIPP
jgi:hypothetical protein